MLGAAVEGAAYVGVPRAVVEQMMQQEAMRVRLHGQPAAEPPYAEFFAWAGQQPAAARGGGGGWAPAGAAARQPG